MQISISAMDGLILCLCIWTGCCARFFSVPVYSMVSRGKYRYLGRVLLHKKSGIYSIRIPAWFIDRSVTTRFVVSLPGFCCRKTEYAGLLVETGKKSKYIMVRDEAEFSLAI